LVLRLRGGGGGTIYFTDLISGIKHEFHVVREETTLEKMKDMIIKKEAFEDIIFFIHGKVPTDE
jgi:hypothetical protein